MSKQTVFLPVGLIMMGFLSGCALFGAGQSTAPPPPPEVLEPRPIQTSTPTPAPGGTARPGDILFVTGGVLGAIGTDGSDGHVLYTPEKDAVLRDLAVSPDGRYAAFTINSGRLMVLDLEEGETTLVDSSPSDRFSSLVWALTGDSLFYHRLVMGGNSKPARSMVMQTAVPPEGEPQSVLDFDLASNMPILPVAAWRGGLLLIHQVDPASGALGQWLVYDSVAPSLSPLLRDYGLWDVSPDRTKMLLFNTADLASGPASPSVPVYSAALDLGRGAVNPTRLTPDDQQVHLESASFGPDGLHIAALQYVGVEGGVRRQVVLMAPGENGKYILAPLAPDPAADDIAFVWGGVGLIVQRLRDGQPELWNVPLDGSAGKLITPGEQPVVVPPR